MCGELKSINISDEMSADIFNVFLELPVYQASWFSPFNIEIMKFDCIYIYIYIYIYINRNQLLYTQMHADTCTHVYNIMYRKIN